MASQKEVLQYIESKGGCVEVSGKDSVDNLLTRALKGGSTENYRQLVDRLVRTGKVELSNGRRIAKLSNQEKSVETNGNRRAGGWGTSADGKQYGSTSPKRLCSEVKITQIKQIPELRHRHTDEMHVSLTKALQALQLYAKDGELEINEAGGLTGYLARIMQIGSVEKHVSNRLISDLRELGLFTRTKAGRHPIYLIETNTVEVSADNYESLVVMRRDKLRQLRNNDRTEQSHTARPSVASQSTVVETVDIDPESFLDHIESQQQENVRLRLQNEALQKRCADLEKVNLQQQSALEALNTRLTESEQNCESLENRLHELEADATLGSRFRTLVKQMHQQ